MLQSKKRNKTLIVLLSILTALLVLAVIGYKMEWKKRFLLYQKTGLPLKDNKYYKAELDTVRKLRMQLCATNAGKEALRDSFIATINTKIFPYWYGTTYGFNGTTQMPNEGSIACGYFVTTTLRDMGVPINRVKMAQSASEEMIRTLTDKKYIYHFPLGQSIDSFETVLKKLGYGLYLTGLDHHTGYTMISPEGDFFIHSSGSFPFMVISEPLGHSSVVTKSKYRVVGKISDDENFLLRWAGNME